MFRTVSIMPGIENLAPDRTETSSGLVGITQLAADLPLEALHLLGDLRRHLLGHRALLEVGATGLGGDREPGRDRQSELDHLGQVRALAAEQVLLVLVPFGEVVDVAHHVSWNPSWACECERRHPTPRTRRTSG